MTAELRRLTSRVVAPAEGGNLAGGFHTEIAWSELLEHVSGVSRLQLSGLLTRRPPALLPYEATGADVATVLAGYRDDVVGGTGLGSSTDVAGRFDAALDELRGLGRLADADETEPVAVTHATPVDDEDPRARHDRLTQVASVLAAATTKAANATTAVTREREVPESSWRPYQPSAPEERAQRKRRRALRARATEPAKRHYVRSIALALVAYGLCRSGFPDVEGPANLVMPSVVFCAAVILTAVPAIPRAMRIVVGVMPGVLLVGFGTHAAIDLPLAVRFAAFVAGLVTTTVYITVAGQLPLGTPKPTGD
ncbi:MAG: hypothetical protein GEV10_05840 [Streptosporangiales bacterium]|nr:hypothetical protein [Streptosporangiales bacterium]